MAEMIAPNGGDIQGTSEILLSASSCTFDTDNPCGYDHTGGSEVWWDTSTTDEIDGVSLFTDDSGEDWLQHHLIPEGTEPLDDTDTAELRSEMRLGRTLEDAKRLKERSDQLSAADRAHLTIMIDDLERRYKRLKQRSLDLVAAHIAAHPVTEDA